MEKRVYPMHISIHALREEGDSCTSSLVFKQQIFLSTPSARRATFDDAAELITGAHFYPRPPRGGRRCFAISLGRYCIISIHALREEGDI